MKAQVSDIFVSI